MGRLLLLHGLFFLVSFTAFSQKDFGRVAADDFDVTFPSEEDAPAIVVYDIGKSVFQDHNNGFRIKFTRTVRIKINRKEGLAYGEVVIPLYKDGYNRTEYVEDIKGFTHYIEENGTVKRVPLGIDMVYDQDYNENYSLKKFALPAVREDAIIEYQYTKITPFVFNLPDWEFQRSIPTLYSSYQVSLIPFYEYSFRLQGANRFDYQTSELEQGIPRTFGSVEYNDMIHTYVMKDVPSFKDESYITTRDDYILKLDFQLKKIIQPYGGSRDIMTTWEDLNEDFLKNEYFGKFLNQSGKYAREVVEKVPAGPDQLRGLIEFVRANYTWDGHFRKFTDLKAKEFAERRKGNSAEINLFLCAVLNEAGYEASPVLISTRDHGQLHTNYPFTDQFNNVILLVKSNEGMILTDGTEQYIPYNTIPPLCINGQGLVVDKDSEQFVNLTGYNQSQITLNLSMAPDPVNEKMDAGILCQAQGYEAYRLRKLLDQDIEEYKANTEKYGITGIRDFETSPGEESKVSMRYSGNGELNKLGENIVIAPFLNWTAIQNLDENPLKNRERKLPVDMVYPTRTIFTSQIKLPEGYVLEDIPSPYSNDDDLVKIDYSCKILGDHVVTQGEAVFKKSVYSAREYLRLRGYMIKMVELFNTELILVKKDMENSPR